MNHSFPSRRYSDLVKTAFYARYSDVILFGPANSYDHPPIRRETAESILFSSGRPVLIVPDGYKAKAIEHVAIGWNATRESTHSLRDATAFARSEEHTSELQSLMRISYAAFCLNKQNTTTYHQS